MFTRSSKPIVFAGPSLIGLSEAKRSRLDLRPPVRRGDFDSLMEARHPGTTVLIDGVFNSTLAITPTECRQLLQKGWRLIGASSMGALRASELWPVGMVGIGDVFMLYRLGILRSDADVAVMLNPVSYEEVTASIVHIRAVLSLLEQQGRISGVFSRKLLNLARGICWFDRHWDEVLSIWRRAGLSADVVETARDLSVDPSYHPKVRDAHLATNTILARRWVEQPQSEKT